MLRGLRPAGDRTGLGAGRRRRPVQAPGDRAGHRRRARAGLVRRDALAAAMTSTTTRPGATSGAAGHYEWSFDAARFAVAGRRGRLPGPRRRPRGRPGVPRHLRQAAPARRGADPGAPGAVARRLGVRAGLGRAPGPPRRARRRGAGHGGAGLPGLERRRPARPPGRRRRGRARRVPTSPAPWTPGGTPPSPRRGKRGPPAPATGTSTAPATRCSAGCRPARRPGRAGRCAAATGRWPPARPGWSRPRSRDLAVHLADLREALGAPVRTSTAATVRGSGSRAYRDWLHQRLVHGGLAGTPAHATAGGTGRSAAGEPAGSVTAPRPRAVPHDHRPAQRGRHPPLRLDDRPHPVPRRHRAVPVGDLTTQNCSTHSSPAPVRPSDAGVV